MRVLVTLLLWRLAEAALSPDVDAVCSTLIAKYPKNVVWDTIGPKAADTITRANTYNSALFDYWNAASANNRAACAFFPSNAEQVSFAVHTLNAYPSVKYALKGGGHSPNLGYSSVDKGVLIAFRPNSQYAIPSADGKTVEVGAGCKWEDVYNALEPLGRTAVGGRLGDVGVMGFTLGGGLSYLSAQYGFACDSVVEFECVLANGTIVTASPKSHPDLYFALRGGGNQYAIVTKMTLSTYEIGDHGKIWGGVRTYGADQHTKILAAITRFTANNKDPKAAIIPTFNYFAVAGINLPGALVFFFYDGTKVPAGVFHDFDAILSLSDSTKVKKYTTLTNEVLGGDMKGLRFQIRENTFPNMPEKDMTAFLSDHFDQILKKSTKGALMDLLDFRLMSFAVQPMPHGIVQASKDKGGSNALGMVPEQGDRVWVEYDVAWLSPLCDKKCPQYFGDVVNSLHDLHVEKYSGIPPTNYKEGDVNFLSYNPIFMNDAMYDQDVLRSYGNTTYDRLKATHDAYDPEGFLSTRQGGFKFSS
ncbi:FAD-binding, type 2 [Purpureocillium lavendulum]|uniref:FAD-binding, type 2 n=1 Tax=Purpureocillium lavendulum TaxID=1247861 RepID=A0AB34FFE0_9HYPO|nr:FAD-binding, type 2 [Purpureocillium lavendulum]